METDSKENIKQNYGLGLLFCLFSIWLLGYVFSKQQLILVLVLGAVFSGLSVFLFNYRISIPIILLFLLFVLYYFIFEYFQLEGITFKTLLDKIPKKYDLRKIIINYLDTNPNKESKGLLLLTLFNIKNSDNKFIYEQILNLSIAHLLVISGLHLSLINLVIQSILKKYKIAGNIASFSILFFYSYLLNFSYGVLRVLLCLLLNALLGKYLKNKNFKFINLAISGIILLMLNPYAFMSYSYTLSYLSVSVIYLIFQIKKLNNFVKSLIASVVINFILGGLIINGYGKINLLTIFWSIILSPIIISLYFINLFLFPFNIVWPFLAWIHSLFLNVVKLLQINYFVINLKQLASWIPYYYLLIYYLFISYMWMKRLN
ncbi:ComEC/Rec2 family competence protein [[Mycoplasma] imitans]|uniref:ComEC/Rec2 family competence protein n=1 Tax=[Mycoplasma] imitans TaxID=29560 RepID=UPI001FE238A5|nr:ComEC/Rec2 family competence protein [[Mycoplasma] imitans]